MNIVVCVKQVPDTWTERKLRSDDKTLDRDAVDGVINELDEYAIEEALQLTEAHGGEVTVLTMGPDRASESIRKALSMGADKAVHLVDDALHGSDALSTSYALAAVLRKIGFDLVILGSESTDARMGVLAAMLAERLGVPQLTLANKVEIDGKSIIDPAAHRLRLRQGRGRLPAVVSAWSRRSTSRATRPSRGSWRPRRSRSRRSASPTPGSTPARSAWPRPGTEVVELREGARRAQAGTIVKDEGDGGSRPPSSSRRKKFI